jgi:hypothetical protein
LFDQRYLLRGPPLAAKSHLKLSHFGYLTRHSRPILLRLLQQPRGVPHLAAVCGSHGAMSSPVMPCCNSAFCNMIQKRDAGNHEQCHSRTATLAVVGSRGGCQNGDVQSVAYKRLCSPACRSTDSVMIPDATSRIPKTRTRFSLPRMPSAPVVLFAAKSSISPNPMLNQPRLRARRTADPNELGPASIKHGSPAGARGAEKRRI